VELARAEEADATLRYQESIQIAAPADVVYDVVADVTSTGDRSPECRRVEWLAEPARAVVGARFRGHNRWRGFTWWRSATIERADRGHEFAFKTEPGHGIYRDTTAWCYRFEPTGDGATRVTESYELTAPWWLQTMDTALGRPKALRNGVHRTLSNLKHAAETASGP
jgi:polyketide cyclase/dehydrase/lipid transport protein